MGNSNRSSRRSDVCGVIATLALLFFVVAGFVYADADRSTLYGTIAGYLTAISAAAILLGVTFAMVPSRSR